MKSNSVQYFLRESGHVKMTVAVAPRLIASATVVNAIPTKGKELFSFPRSGNKFHVPILLRAGYSVKQLTKNKEERI